jgi:hypothetical protein
MKQKSQHLIYCFSVSTQNDSGINIPARHYTDKKIFLQMESYRITY